MMHKLADKILHPHRKEEEVVNKPAVVVHSERELPNADLHKGKVATHSVVNDGVTTHDTVVKYVLYANECNDQ